MDWPWLSLLDGMSRYYRVLRTLVFVPQVLSAVVVSFIFVTILSNGGILNSVLESIGLESQSRALVGQAEFGALVDRNGGHLADDRLHDRGLPSGSAVGTG